MKRNVLFVGTLILLLILAACSGTQESNEAVTPREDVTESVPVEEAEPVDVETEMEEAEPAPVETEPETAVEVEEAAPVEVKEEAVGKPQLIEFYADW